MCRTLVIKHYMPLKNLQKKTQCFLATLNPPYWFWRLSWPLSNIARKSLFERGLGTEDDSPSPPSASLDASPTEPEEEEEDWLPIDDVAPAAAVDAGLKALKPLYPVLGITLPNTRGAMDRGVIDVNDEGLQNENGERDSVSDLSIRYRTQMAPF